MKLKLPARLRAAILRCMIAATPLVSTLSTGALAVGGVVFSLNNADAAEEEVVDESTDATGDETSDAVVVDLTITNYNGTATFKTYSELDAKYVVFDMADDSVSDKGTSYFPSTGSYYADTIEIKQWYVNNGTSGSSSSWNSYHFNGTVIGTGDITFDDWGSNAYNAYYFWGDMSAYEGDITSIGQGLSLNICSTNNTDTVSGKGEINLEGGSDYYLTYTFGSGNTVSINNTSITAPTINFNGGATYDVNCSVTANYALNVADNTTLNVNSGLSSVDVTLGSNATLYIAEGVSATNTGDLNMGTGATLVIDGTYTFAGTGTRTGASATINEGGTLAVTMQATWSASVTNAGTLSLITGSALSGYVSASTTNQIIVNSTEGNSNHNLIWNGTLSSSSEDVFYSVDVNDAAVGLLSGFSLDLGETVENGTYLIMTEVGDISYTGDYIDGTVANLSDEQGSEWSYDSTEKTLSVTIYDLDHITWNGEGTEDYWRDTDVWLSENGEATSFQKLDYVTIGSASDSAESAAYTIEVVMDLILSELNFVGDRDWNLTASDFSTIDVHGDLTKSGSGTVTVGLDIISTDSINVTGGTLNLAGVTGSTGDITLASGATLTFSGDVESISSISMASNSSMSVAGSATVTGNITVGTSASLDFESGFSGTSSVVTLNGGTLTLGDNTTFKTLDVSGVGAELIIESGATVNITEYGYTSEVNRRQTASDFTITIEEGAVLNDSATFWVGQGHVQVTGGGTYNLERLLIGYTSVGGEIKFTVGEDTTLEIKATGTATSSAAALTIGAVGAEASLDVQGTLILNSGISVWGSTTKSTLTVYDGGTLQLNAGINAVTSAATPEIAVKTGGTLSLGNNSGITAHVSAIDVNMATGSTLTTNGVDTVTTTYQQINFADNATINFVVNTGETLDMQGGVVINNGTAIISGGGTLAVEGRYDETDGWIIANHDWVVTSGSTLDFSGCDSYNSLAAAGGDGTLSLQNGATLKVATDANLLTSIEVVGTGNVITTASDGGTITLEGSFVYGESINSLSFAGLDIDITSLEFIFDNGIASGEYIVFTDINSWDATDITYEYTGLITGQSVTLAYDEEAKTVTLTVDGRGNENLLWSGGDGYWPKLESEDTHWVNNGGNEAYNTFQDGDNVTFGQVGDTTATSTVTLSQSVETSSINFIGDGTWNFVNEDGNEYTITNMGMLTKTGKGTVNMNVQIASIEGITVTEGGIIFSEAVTQAGDITVSTADGAESESFLTFGSTLGTAGDVVIENATLSFGGDVESLGTVWVNEGGTLNFAGDINSMTALVVNSKADGINIEEGGVTFDGDLNYVETISLAGGTNTFNAVTCNTYNEDGSVDERGTLSISGGTNTFNGTVKAGYIELNGGTNSFQDIVVYDELDIRTGTTTLNASVTFNTTDVGDLIVRSGATLISNYHHTGLENIYVYGDATFEEGLTQTVGTLSVRAASAVVNINDTSSIKALSFSYGGTVNINGENTVISTLTMANSGTINFTESSSVDTLNFSSSSTIALQSLDGDEVTVTIKDGASTSLSSSTSNIDIGNATYFSVGDNTTLSIGYQLRLSANDSLTISGEGTVEMSSLLIGTSSTQGDLLTTINEGSTLKITGTLTDNSVNYSGLVLCAGSTGTTGNIDVYGTLESNAGLSIYTNGSTTGTGTINVYDGGTLQLNRGTLASVASADTLTVNVKSGATLSLGNTVTDDGTASTTDYSSDYSIVLESGAIVTGNGMTYNGDGSFTESNQTDVTFSFSYDSDANITLQSDAGDTLIMHDVFTTDLEYVTVTGGGTVKILQDGSDRATYHIQVTGGTTLDTSSSSNVSDTLGYYTNGYLVLNTGTLQLADGGDLDRIIVSYGSGNVITTTSEGGTLTLSSGIQYEGVQYATDFDLSISLDSSLVILDDDFRFNFFDGIEEGSYTLLTDIGSLTLVDTLLESGTYTLDDITVKGLSDNQSSESSYFTYDSETGTLTLTVVGTIFNTLTWDEADGGIWSTSADDTTWASGDSSDLTFAGKDTVIFDSSVFTDVSTIAVTLNETLAVTNMTVTGDGIAWTIDGSGSISEISQLTKSGTSSATINVAVGDIDILHVQAGNLTFGSTVANMGDVTVAGGVLTANGDVSEVGSLQITTGGEAIFNGTGTMDSIGNIIVGPYATGLTMRQAITSAGDITIRGGAVSFANIESAGNILISQNATNVSFGDIGSVGSIEIIAGSSLSFGNIGDINGALTVTGSSDSTLTVNIDSINGTVGDITLNYADVEVTDESDITAGAISINNGSLTVLDDVSAESLSLIASTFTTTGDLLMTTTVGDLTVVDSASFVSVGNNGSSLTVGGDLITGTLTLSNGSNSVGGTTEALTIALSGGTATFEGAASANTLSVSNQGTFTFNSMLTLNSDLSLSGSGTLNLVGGLLSDGDVSVSGTSTLIATGAAKMDDLTVSGGSAVFNGVTAILGDITLSGGSSIEINNGLTTEGDTNVTSSGGTITFDGGTSSVVELADFEINSGSKTTFNITAGTSLNFTNITSQDYGTTNSVTYYFTKVDDDLTINLGAGASMNFDELIWLEGAVDVLIEGDGGTVTMEGVFMGYNGSAASLEVTAGNTLILTGTDFNYNTFNSSFNLAANGGTGTVSVGGTLVVNTGVQVYSGTGTLNVQDGGTLQLNAGLMAARDASDNLYLNALSGSTLALGNQTTTGTDYSNEMVLLAQSGSTIIDNGVAETTTVEHTIAFESGAAVTLATSSAGSTLVFDKEVTARTYEKETSDNYDYIYSDVDSTLNINIAGAGTVEFAAGASLNALSMDAGSNLNITSTVTANSLSSNAAEEGVETGETVLLVTGGDLTVGTVDDYTGAYEFNGGALTVTESTTLSNDIIMLGQGTISTVDDNTLTLTGELSYIDAWTSADSYTLALGDGVTLGEGFSVDLMGLIDSNDNATSYTIFSGIDQAFYDAWMANEYYSIDEGFVCTWTYNEDGTLSLAVSSNILFWDGGTNENWSDQNWNDYFGADTEYLDSAIVNIGDETHLHSDEMSITLDQDAKAASLSFVGDGQWTISNADAYTFTIDGLLSKSGDGNVSITADFSSVGSIEITGGTLSITGNVGDIGSGSGAIDIVNGSSLSISGYLGNTGDLNLEGGLHVDGNVGAVGAITVGQYLEIGGNLTSAGDIVVSGLMSVGGETGTVGSILVNDDATLTFAGGLDSANSVVTLAGGTIEFGADSSIFEYKTSAADSTISVTGNSTLTIGSNNTESYPFQTTSYSLSFDIEDGSKIVDKNGLWTGQQLVTVTGGGTLEISQLLVGYTASGSGDQELKVFIDKDTTMEITGTITGTDYSAGACTAAFTIGAYSGADAFVDVHGTLIINSGIATYSNTGESHLTVYDGATLTMNDGIYGVIGSNTDAIDVTIKTNGTLSLGNSSVQSTHDDDIVVTMESDSTLTTNGVDDVTTTYQQIDFAENGTITFDIATGDTLHMASGVIIENGKAIITGGGTLAVTAQLNADGSYTTASQSWDVYSGSTLDFSSNTSPEAGEAAGGQGTISLIDGGTLVLTNAAYLQANVYIEGAGNVITVNVTDESTATLTLVGSMSYGNKVNSVSFDNTTLSLITDDLYTFDFTMGLAAGTYTLFTDSVWSSDIDTDNLSNYFTVDGLADGQDYSFNITTSGDLEIIVEGRGHETLYWAGGSNEWPTTTEVTYWDNINYTLVSGDEGYDIEMDKFYDGDNVIFGTDGEDAVGGTVTLSRDVITSSISFIGDGDWEFNNEEGYDFSITNNGTLTKSGAGTVTVNVEISNLLGVTVTEGILYFSEEVKQAGDLIVTNGSLGFAGGLYEANDVYVTNGQIGFGDEGVGRLGSVWLYEDASADFYGDVQYMDELHITSGGWYIIAKGDLKYVGLMTIADGVNEFVGVNTNVYDEDGNITDGGTIEITGGTNTFTGTVSSNTLTIEAGTNSFTDIETYDELDIRAGTTTLNGKVTFTSEEDGLVIVRSGAKLISNYHHTGLEDIDLYGTATFNQGINQSTGTINLYTSEATLTVNSGDTSGSVLDTINLEAAATVIINDTSEIGTVKFSTETGSVSGTASFYANDTTNITTLTMNRINSYAEINGDGSTIGTLNMTSAGSHIVFTDDATIGTLGSFSAQGTIEVQAESLAEADAVLVEINGGAKTSSSSHYEYSAEMNIVVGANTTLSEGKMMWRAGGTLDVSGGGTYELTSLLIGCSSNVGNVTVNVQADTLMHITSTATTYTNSNNGFFLNGSNDGTYGVVNVYGTLESDSALLLYGTDSRADGGEINVYSGGTLQLNQGTAAAYSTSNGGVITLNIADGGTLSLGDTAESYGDNATDQFIINLASGATVTGNGSAVSDIYFSFTYESDATIYLVADEGENLVMHHTFTDAFEMLYITGGGTVTIDETSASESYLQDHDWYVTGGTTLDLSYEANASDSLGYVATGTVTLNDATVLLQDEGALNRIVILEGEASTVTTTAGSGDGTLTLNSGLQYAESVFENTFDLTLDVDGNDLILGDEFRFNFLEGIDEGSYDLITNIGDFTIISDGITYVFSDEMTDDEWAAALATIEIRGLSEGQSADYEFTLVYDEGTGTLSLDVVGTMITELTWDASSGASWSASSWMDTDTEVSEQEFATRYTVNFDSSTYEANTSMVVNLDEDAIVSKMNFIGAGQDADITWYINGNGKLSQIAELHKVGFSTTYINVEVGNIDLLEMEHGALIFTESIASIGDFWVEGGELTMQKDVGTIDDIVVKTTGKLLIEGNVGAIDTITIGPFATGMTIEGTIGSTGDIAIGGGVNAIGDILGNAGVIAIDGGTTDFGSIGNAESITVYNSDSSNEIHVSTDGNVTTGSLVSTNAQFFMYDTDENGTLTVLNAGDITFTGSADTPTLDTENGYLVSVAVSIEARDSAMTLDGDYTALFSESVRVNSLTTTDTIVTFDGGVDALNDITVSGGSATLNAASYGDDLTVSSATFSVDGGLTLTGALSSTNSQFTLTDSQSEAVALTMSNGGDISISGSSSTATTDADGYLLRVEVAVAAVDSDMTLTGNYTALFTESVTLDSLTTENTYVTFESGVNSTNDIDVSGGSATFNGDSYADNVIASNDAKLTFNESITLKDDIVSSGENTVTTFNESILEASDSTQINLISSGGTIVFATSNDVKLYDFDLIDGYTTTIVVGGTEYGGIDLSFVDIGTDEIYDSRQLDENLTFSLYNGSSVTMDEAELWFGADFLTLERADDSSVGNADVTVNALLVGYTVEFEIDGSILTVGEGVTLTILGDTLNTDTIANSSFTITGCGHDAWVEVYGTLVTNSGIQAFWGDGVLNVYDGATLQMNAGLMAAYATIHDTACTLLVDVKDGATLVLGDQLDTVDYSNLMDVVIHEGSTIMDNGSATEQDSGYVSTTYHTLLFADDDEDGYVAINLVSSDEGYTLSFGSEVSDANVKLIAMIQGEGQVEFAGNADLEAINIYEDSTVVISSAVSTESVGHYEESTATTYGLGKTAAAIAEDAVTSNMIITTDSGAVLSLGSAEFTAYDAQDATIVFTSGSSLNTGSNASMAEMTGTVSMTNTYIAAGSLNVASGDTLIIANSSAKNYVTLNGGTIQVDDGELIMPIQVTTEKGSITTTDGVDSLVLNGQISYDGTWTNSTTYTIDMTGATSATMGDDFQIVFSEDLTAGTAYQILADVGDGFAESMTSSNYIVIGGSDNVYYWYDNGTVQGNGDGTDLWVYVQERAAGYIWDDANKVWVQDVAESTTSLESSALTTSMDIIFDSDTYSDDASEYNDDNTYEDTLSVGKITVRGNDDMSITSTSLTADAGFVKEGEGTFTMNTQLSSVSGIFVKEGALVITGDNNIVDDTYVTEGAEFTVGNISFTTTADGDDEATAMGVIDLSSGEIATNKLSNADLTDIAATVAATEGTTAIDTVSLSNSSITLDEGAKAALSSVTVKDASQVTVGESASATITSSSFAGESDLAVQDGGDVTVTDTSFSESDITMGDDATADITATSMVDVDIALGSGSTADIDAATLNGETNITTGSGSSVDLAVDGYVTNNTITVSAADATTEDAGTVSIATSYIGDSAITVTEAAQATVTADTIKDTTISVGANASATVEDATVTTSVAVLAAGATLELSDVVVGSDFEVTQSDAGSGVVYSASTSTVEINSSTLVATDTGSSSNLTISTDADTSTKTYTITTFSGLATGDSTSSATASGNLTLYLTLSADEYSAFFNDFGTDTIYTFIIDDVTLDGADGAEYISTTVQIASEGVDTYTFVTANAVQIGNDLVISVPEPSTATLSLLALAGMLARRRRRQA